MLVTAFELQKYFGVKPNGVLHVGAHEAEEATDYLQLGWNGKHRIIWIEADPDLFEKLRKSLLPEDHKVLCAAAWSENGLQREFIRTTSSQSNSLLELNEHKKIFPEILEESRIQVTTKRVESILDENDYFSMVNIDTQGSELHVLKGLGVRLDQVKYVFCEVNKTELYSGSALLPEIDSFLDTNGFRRVVTKWAGKGSNWGDALYVRKEEIPRFLPFRKLFLILSRAIKLKHPIAIKNLFFGEIE